MEDDAAAESMNVFMVGIKGAGMSSLAVLLQSIGFAVSGSDSPEYFITQDNLAAHGINWHESWDPCIIPSQCSLVIHSSAYDSQSHPQICEARKKSIPVYTYSAYIGRLSEESACSCCISGTHGKTTTSAFIEQLLIALELPAFAVYGSYSSAAAGDSGSTRFPPLSGNPLKSMAGIIEACEYNRHFLQLHPDVLVITNIDYDHPDTYRDMQETQKAFSQLAGQISEHGYFVYCADDPPSALTAAGLTASRPDIRLIPYGETAKGSFSVRFLPDEESGTIFQLGCSAEPICLPVPGRHIALDAAGAAAAAASVLALSCEKDSSRVFSRNSTTWERLFLKVSSQAAEACTRIYPLFRGLHRRSEILGTAGGVLVMDDYAHHPTEIQAMLVGLKRYYSDKRIIVDFMAHTFSRTRALFTRFTQAFSEADYVMIHPVFSSARERGSDEETQAEGRKLAEAIPRAHFVESNLEAARLAYRILRPGDLFISLGAGSNRETAERVLAMLAAGIKD